MYSGVLSLIVSQSGSTSNFVISACETLCFDRRAEALFSGGFSGTSWTGGGGGIWKALVFALVVFNPRGARFRGPSSKH